MNNKRKHRVTRTWFDIDCKRFMPSYFDGAPTGFFLTLENLIDDPRFHESETGIFEHISEHEVADAEGRGSIAGPITVGIGNHKRSLD